MKVLLVCMKVILGLVIVTLLLAVIFPENSIIRSSEVNLYPTEKYPELTKFSLKEKLLFQVEGTMEATPIVWGGELFIVNFDRFSKQVRFYDRGGKLIRVIKKNAHLGSAFVDGNDILHILYTANFDSLDWGKCIKKMKVAKDFSIIDDKLVFCAESKESHIFNTSMTKSENKYYIAYEVADDNGSHFYTRFLSSGDLESWEHLGINFRKGTYTACPTLKYYKGDFYLFFLDDFYDKRNEMKLTFATRVAKGKDLKALNEVNVIVLDPRDSTSSEGINNSDFDFIQFNGKQVIVYADGNQQTYVNLKVVEYEGDEEVFFNNFNIRPTSIPRTLTAWEAKLRNLIKRLTLKVNTFVSD